MKGIRIRWHAVVPAIGVATGILTSPQVLAALPEKWSNTILGISAVAAVFFPAVATNRPPHDPPVDNPNVPPQQFRSK